MEFKVTISTVDGTILHSSDETVSKSQIGFGELPEAYELGLQSMKQGTN